MQTATHGSPLTSANVSIVRNHTGNHNAEGDPKETHKVCIPSLRYGRNSDADCSYSSQLNNKLSLDILPQNYDVLSKWNIL